MPKQAGIECSRWRMNRKKNAEGLYKWAECVSGRQVERMRVSEGDIRKERAQNELRRVIPQKLGVVSGREAGVDTNCRRVGVVTMLARAW